MRIFGFEIKRRRRPKPINNKEFDRFWRKHQYVMRRYDGMPTDGPLGRLRKAYSACLEAQAELDNAYAAAEIEGLIEEER